MMESIEKLRRMSHMFDSWHEEHMDGEPYIEVRHYTNGQRDFDSIGDHIRELLDEVEAEISERYMPLPLDADGVTIRIGDVLDPPADCDDYVPLQVMRLMYDGYEQEWFFDGQAGGFCGMAGEHMDAAGWTHHHARTIEDVLEEFGSKMHGITTEERERLVSEAADEIRGLI